MLFSLKNAGATYQYLVNKMFQQHLGKTIDVYVDDMLIKFLKSKEHRYHLEQTKQVNFWRQIRKISWLSSNIEWNQGTSKQNQGSTRHAFSNVKERHLKTN